MIQLRRTVVCVMSYIPMSQVTRMHRSRYIWHTQIYGWVKSHICIHSRKIFGLANCDSLDFECNIRDFWYECTWNPICWHKIHQKASSLCTNSFFGEGHATYDVLSSGRAATERFSAQLPHTYWIGQELGTFCIQAVVYWSSFVLRYCVLYSNTQLNFNSQLHSNAQLINTKLLRYTTSLTLVQSSGRAATARSIAARLESAVMSHICKMSRLFHPPFPPSPPLCLSRSSNFSSALYGPEISACLHAAIKEHPSNDWSFVSFFDSRSSSKKN